MAEAKIKSTLRRLMDEEPFPLMLRPLARLASYRLKVVDRKVKTIQERVELTFSWRPFPVDVGGFFAIEPGQQRKEIEQFLLLVSALRPSAILEIGTARGGTLFLLASIATPDGVILSIDLPHGHFGGGYPEWKRSFYSSFARSRQKMILIRADSHDPSVLREASKALSRRPLDLLFIDGDHRYEGVRSDYETYGQLVRRGGIIAFHDIFPGPWQNVGEVHKFWKELKATKDFLEIGNRGEQWGGIGVLFVR